MKTIKTMKSLIDSTVSEILAIRDSHAYTRKEKKAKERTRLHKLNYYREVLMYLETNPNKDFLVTSLEKLRDRSRAIDSSFDEWKRNTPVQFWGDNPRSKFRELTGLTNIDSQIKTLTFILED